MPHKATRQNPLDSILHELARKAVDRKVRSWAKALLKGDVAEYSEKNVKISRNWA